MRVLIALQSGEQALLVRLFLALEDALLIFIGLGGHLLVPI